MLKVKVKASRQWTETLLDNQHASLHSKDVQEKLQCFVQLSAAVLGTELQVMWLNNTASTNTRESLITGLCLTNYILKDLFLIRSAHGNKFKINLQAWMLLVLPLHQSLFMVQIFWRKQGMHEKTLL